MQTYLERYSGIERFPPVKEKLPCGKDLFIVFNRRSHGGCKKTEELIRFCKLHGLKTNLFDIRKSGDLEGIIQEIFTTSENPFLVIIGGDGTHSSVASELIKAGKNDLPVIFAAAGSGQDLARAMGNNRPGIEQVLLKEQVDIEKFDALRVVVTRPNQAEEVQYAIGHVSFGITAKSAAKINAIRPKTIVGNIFISLKSITSDKIRVDLPKEGRRDCSDLIIVNSKTFGRYLHSSSHPQDGRYETYLLEGNPLALSNFAALSLVRPARGDRRSEIEFTLLDPVKPQLDGEQKFGIEPLPARTQIKVEIAKGVVPAVKP
ncbi:MAG: hypothetical protein A2152_03515 [Candidatus Levybacteria bacterium RBG_16_35_6]|nr:MAG: hypothetical protein A2152_03515 [Candidatus Levybacteria bacterium RBG_16_35_6]